MVSGAAVAAGALVVTLSLSPFAPLASAATGSFTYTAADGKPRTSSAAGNNFCIALPNASGPVKNKTNADIELYSTPKCDQGTDFETIGAGETKNVPSFQGIKWVDSGDDGDDGGDDDD